MFGLSLLIHCDFPGIQGFGGFAVVEGISDGVADVVDVT
jgi:hypothetical protein